MQKLPVVSGYTLIKLMMALGYKIIRQKGSHVLLGKSTAAGDHKITVPLHDEMAKGTLSDILLEISVWNGISKDELILKLRDL